MWPPHAPSRKFTTAVPKKLSRPRVKHRLGGRWDTNVMTRHLLLLIAATAGALAERHTLTSTPKTVHWGDYAATRAPVLRVRSGDTVEIRTAMIDPPEALERAGIAADQIDPASREIHRIKER